MHFRSSGNDCIRKEKDMEERRQKGRKGEEEGGKGGGKEEREERRKGREGGMLDMGPDMSESCNYNDVLTFYKVSEHPENTGDIYYQAVC